MKHKIHLFLTAAAILLVTGLAANAQSIFDVKGFIDKSTKVDKEIIDGSTIPGLGSVKEMKTYTNPKGITLTAWLDENGKIVPRVKKSSYCLVVPGPEGHFVRKAWISADGKILEEERRAYDENGRLISEGYVDPETGAFEMEFRHRYSEDGNTQYTTEYANGIKKGEETSTVLQQSKTSDHPFASAVPDKKGYVFSPHTKQVIDVQNIKPGELVEDPTSKGKFFRVP